MNVDEARVSLMRALLAAQGYDAIIVRAPANVLMLSGYAPIVGDSYCYFRQSGKITLVVPESEASLAEEGWAEEILTFSDEREGQADYASEQALPILRDLLGHYGRDNKLGYESGPTRLAVSYGFMGLPDRGSAEVLKVAGHRAVWYDCTDLMDAGALWKSPREVEHLRLASRVALEGLTAACLMLTSGAREGAIEGAALAEMADAPEIAGRILSFAHVAVGGATTAVRGPILLTSKQGISAGQSVVIQIEASVNGYWASVGRTFWVGAPSEAFRAAYQAAAAAREAALGRVGNGVLGGEVDDSARHASAELGFELARQVGQGVGFSAGNPMARPVLGPTSIDPIRPIQAFSISPSVVSPAGFGVRIHDTVVFGNRGLDILTPAPWSLDEVMVSG